jgi:hypothetical protein
LARLGFRNLTRADMNHKMAAAAANASENVSSANFMRRTQRPLPPHTHAIDATIHIPTSVVPDGGARDRARPEYDAGPGNAPPGISNVCAVDDRIGWRWSESETCKPQQGAGGNPGKCC